SLAGARNVESLERRMVLDVVRCLTVRDLPFDFASVEIDRGDAPVRWFSQRQSSHGQSAATLAPWGFGGRGSARRSAGAARHRSTASGGRPTAAGEAGSRYRVARDIAH